MELVIDTAAVMNSAKNGKELNIDVKIDTLKEQFGSVTSKVIDKAADYVIKAAPIPDALKDILKDVKDVLKTKDFKKIINTVIESSAREGLEILGLDKKSITDIMKLKDVVKKGGLIHGVVAAIDIVAKKYLKNNIVGDYVYNFFNKLKEYVMNNGFSTKLENSLKKIDAQKDKFLIKCDKWYEAYKKLDFENMGKIGKELNTNKKVTMVDNKCFKTNKEIQNIYQMAINKGAKLSESQLELCKSI